ncbi:TSUP family transporter [Sulfitobacter sp.]|uniref:TSUP family transporter n=1 Tax=Sulfitobacter sp. TaxID=1903071 RepID=UPI0035628CE4
MQGLAVIVFIVSGAVDWPSVFVVACASIAGGWASVRIGKLIPQQAIRWGVIVTGLVLSSSYAFG